MPRILSPALLPMLWRANPNVADIVEMSVPDQSAILRRSTDQFLLATGGGGPLVSMTPAATAVASPNGGLQLASAAVNLSTQYIDAGAFNIPQEDGGDKYVNTLAWRLDQAFAGAVLSSFTARLHWLGFAFLNRTNVKLQIFRATQTAGVLQRPFGTSTIETKQTQYSFTPLLAEPIVVKWIDLYTAGAFDGAGYADVVFDLTPYRLQIDARSANPPGPGQTGDLPELYFAVTTDQQSAGTYVEWRYDTTSAQNVAGVGFFRELSWNRADPSNPASLWYKYESGHTLMHKLKVLQYSATSQEVYALTMPKAPAAASLGRVVFNAGVPSGTSASLELSTAGAGGPWTAVKNGDPLGSSQATYHARLTMNASADSRRSPIVNALGVEFRNRVDLSPESLVSHMSQEVAVPFLAASVGEGSVTVVRAGRRDYMDAGSDLAVSGADTALEVDIFTGSRHPAISRGDWLHLTRASVSARVPSGTAERFTLLSLTKTLKRKIPAQIEAINTVHTVQAGATTTAVVLSPALTGASALGNEYDGRNYYVRVRRSTTAGIDAGAIFTIAGNTNTTQLDFNAGIVPVAPNTGDEWEVHSGTFSQPALSWVDQDLADIWWQLLTVQIGVPNNRIGLADSGGLTGRAGLPPRVTDWAPGDAARQAKLKVTLKLKDAENGDELLDQVSLLLGGATVEIGGQIVFRQIYPLRDANGKITVAPDATTVTFDHRDTIGLETPTGREQRITTIGCDYGVDTTTGSSSDPVSTAYFTDADSLAAYQSQDMEGLGTTSIPSKIARWCYNSADAGLVLATATAQMIVFAASTGLRIWSWGSVDAHPELTIGDTVVVVTDQYTDFDPALGKQIRGWRAYTLTLIGTSEGGRRFRGYMQGLRDVSSVTVTGGGGILPGGAPRINSGNLNFPDASNTEVVVVGNEDTLSLKVVISTASAPTLAAVQAATPIAGQNIDVTVGLAVAVGQRAYLAVLAYAGGSGSGNESPLYSMSVVRQGTGYAAPPSLAIDESGAKARTTATLQLRGVAGAGSPGTLTSQYMLDGDFTASSWTAPVAGTTRTITVTRPNWGEKTLTVRVTQPDGQYAEDSYTVMNRMDAMDATSGGVVRSFAYDDGSFSATSTTSTGLQLAAGMGDSYSRPVNDAYFRSTHSLDNISEGGSYKRIAASRVSAGRATIDLSEAIHSNINLAYMPDAPASGRYAGAQVAATGEGSQMLSNPEFAGGSLSSISNYDNLASGRVVLTAVADATAPNTSGWVLRITVAAPGSAIDPGLGGFTTSTLYDNGSFAPDTYHQGAKYILRLRAKIPVGYSLGWAANAFGNGQSGPAWLTSQAGTGAWAEYVCTITAGVGGTLSSIGYWYIVGTDAAVTWYVALNSMMNVTTVGGVATTYVQARGGGKADPAFVTGTMRFKRANLFDDGYYSGPGAQTADGNTLTTAAKDGSTSQLLTSGYFRGYHNADYIADGGTLRVTSIAEARGGGKADPNFSASNAMYRSRAYDDGGYNVLSASSDGRSITSTNYEQSTGQYISSGYFRGYHNADNIASGASYRTMGTSESHQNLAPQQLASNVLYNQQAFVIPLVDLGLSVGDVFSFAGYLTLLNATDTQSAYYYFQCLNSGGGVINEWDAQAPALNTTSEQYGKLEGATIQTGTTQIRIGLYSSRPSGVNARRLMINRGQKAIPYTDAPLRLNRDNTDVILDGTGAPLTGGKRGYNALNASSNIYRGRAYDDGYYAIRGDNGYATGAVIQAGVQDARLLGVNTMFGKTADTLENVADGATYGRSSYTRLGYADRAGTAISSSSNIYRARAFDDGNYAIQGVGSSTTIIGSATDNVGRNVNVAYFRGYHNSDDIVSGATSKVPLLSTLDAGGVLRTAVGAAATIDGRGAAMLVRAGSKLFSEAVDNDLPVNWTGASSGVTYFTTAAAGGVVGPRIARFTDTVQMYGSIQLPINPAKLYKLVCRVRQNSVGTAAAPYLYMGIKGYLGDGTVANNNGGNLYMLAAGLTLGVTGWIEYTGWMQGTTQAFTNPSAIASSNAGTPLAPQPFNVGTVAIVPLILANYPGAGATSGAQLDLDYFQIWEQGDEDQAYRTYNVLSSAGRVYRGRAFDDGNFAIQSASSGSLTAHASVTDSNSHPVNNAFFLSTHTVDNLADGSTFGKATYSRLGYADRAGTALSSAGKVVRGNAFDDGNFALQSASSGSLTVHAAATDANARTVTDAFYRSYHNADHVSNGATQRAIPLTTIDIGGQLLGGVGGMPVDKLSASAGKFFSETFTDGAYWSRRWNATNAVGTSLTIVNGVGSVGGPVLQIQGYDWRQALAAAQPFNPTKLYRLRARFRQTVDSAGGANNVYLGLTSFDNTGAQIGASYANYCLVFGQALTVAMGWQEVTAWVRGTGQPVGSSSVTPSTDPANPQFLWNTTAYIAPMWIFNYAGGTGTAQLDYYQIDELDEDASGRTYAALRSDGTAKPTFRQYDGTNTKSYVRGGLAGSIPHNTVLTFPTAQQWIGAPNVTLTGGGLFSQVASKWGTAAAVDAGTAASASAGGSVYNDTHALNVTRQGFTCRARLWQKASPTARVNDFGSGNSVSSVGSTVAVTLTNAPANNDTYTIRLTCSVTANYSGTTGSGTVTIVVALDKDPTGTGSWTEVGTASYSSTADTSTTVVTTSTADSFVGTASGFNSSGQFRLRIKSITLASHTTATSSFLHGWVAAADGAAGASYNTSSGDTFASRTPDAGDAIDYSVAELAY